MNLQRSIYRVVGLVTDVGDHPVELLPLFTFGGGQHDLEAIVAGRVHRRHLGPRTPLHAARRRGGQTVRRFRQLGTPDQRIISDRLDRQRPRSSGRPDHPGALRPLRQPGQGDGGGRGRETVADQQRRTSGVAIALPARHVHRVVGDPLTRLTLAQRRHAAATQPIRVTPAAAAIHYDVRLLVALALGGRDQQPERSLRAHAITDVLVLQQARPAHRHHPRSQREPLGHSGALGQRQQVALAPLGARLARIVAGQLMAQRFEGAPSQRRVVHPERREQLDVSPLGDVLGDGPALVDADPCPQRGGVKGGLEADGPRADHGDRAVSQMIFVCRCHSALLQV